MPLFKKKSEDEAAAERIGRHALVQGTRAPVQDEGLSVFAEPEAPAVPQMADMAVRQQEERRQREVELERYRAQQAQAIQCLDAVITKGSKKDKDAALQLSFLLTKAGAFSGTSS